ncbi:hypothetical protein CR513_62095, partial [Mucuna pruriens]
MEDTLKFKSKVKFGDDNSINIIGKGVIYVQNKKGTLKLINNVLYVPLFYQNILGLGHLVQKIY